MNQTPWLLLDTETNGITPPLYVVELGAQKMRGWLPDGPPFRRLLNHNADMTPEASRVNGYTREILERDGDDPRAVYRDFAAYAGQLPVVTYNLPYDWDTVLLPEWQRLGLSPIGQLGFCALELARRLLDPVPAGNCKLQTLRQFYRLPDRAAHTAMGDVQTVADLFEQVLRPLAEARGLHTWADVVALTQSTWFPSRIAFGAHKGRLYQEAAADQAPFNWLQWLAGSSNTRSASMGRWYLAQLAAGAADPATVDASHIAAQAPSSHPGARGGVVVYLSAQVGELQQLNAAARTRLAELEADHTEQQHAVGVTLAQLFKALKTHYQRRDHLKLKIEHSKQYLNVLLDAGEEEAEQTNEAYQQARKQSDADYAQAEADAATKEALTEAQSAEIKAIWRKLVKAFHPDRCIDDEAKREAHEWLTAEINQARDRGDIERLKAIAKNPDDYLRKHGRQPLGDAESTDLVRLRSLFNSLQQRILEVLEALNTLHESPGYLIHQRTLADPATFDATVTEHIQILEAEIDELETVATKLSEEIDELVGNAA